MEALIYGAKPINTMEKRSIEPPVSAENTPSKLFCSKILFNSDILTPGTVICAAILKTSKINSVNRILRRRVGDRQICLKYLNTIDFRF